MEIDGHYHLKCKSIGWAILGSLAALMILSALTNPVSVILWGLGLAFIIGVALVLV